MTVRVKKKRKKERKGEKEKGKQQQQHVPTADILIDQLVSKVWLYLPDLDSAA